MISVRLNTFPSNNIQKQIARSIKKYSKNVKTDIRKIIDDFLIKYAYIFYEIEWLLSHYQIYFCNNK